MNGEFDKALSGPDGPFKPVAYYDENGDCVEFIAKRGPFRGKRFDDLLTVYYDRETDEIVGSQIKRISKVLKDHPGIVIYIREKGRVRITHIIRARAYQSGDAELVKVYGELVRMAEESKAEAEILVPA